VTTAFARGLVAGYGIAIPVGAIAVMIVMTSAHLSFGHGLAAGLGAATADFLYATVAVLAGAALAHFLRAAATPLHLAGGTVLVAIAVVGVRAALRRSQGEPAASVAALGSTYGRFVGLTLINPLTVVYFASVVVGSQTAGSTTTAAAFVLGVALASASWQALLAATGALAGQFPVRTSARSAVSLAGYTIVLVLAALQFRAAG